MNLKILHWNVWYKEKINNIARLIKQSRSNIICLQELTVNRKYNNYIDTSKHLANRLGYYYFFKSSQQWLKNGKTEIQGNGIFSEFPITKKTFHYLQEPAEKSNDYGNYEKEGRAYIEAKLFIRNNLQLSIGTTHLSYTHRFIITQRKKREANKLMQILKHKKEKYIFTGDLNARPNSYIVKQIKKYLRHAGPPVNKNTWTTKPFDYLGFKEKDLNWRLDYVFITKDIKVKKAEIIKTSFSDHLPISVEIEV